MSERAMPGFVKTSLIQYWLRWRWRVMPDWKIGAVTIKGDANINTLLIVFAVVAGASAWATTRDVGVAELKAQVAELKSEMTHRFSETDKKIEALPLQAMAVAQLQKVIDDQRITISILLDRAGKADARIDVLAAQLSNIQSGSGVALRGK